MGANVSTTVSKVIQETENVTKLECDMKQTVNQMISDISVELDNAHCDNIIIGNRATVQSKCNLDAIARSLAEKASKLTQQQKANLGTLNVSTDVDLNQQLIKNIIEAKCGSEQLINQSYALLFQSGPSLLPILKPEKHYLVLLEKKSYQWEADSLKK